MNLFGRDIALAIFDLDGTLIDSTHLWADIDRAFFEKRHTPLPEDYGRIISHLGLEAGAAYTRETYFPDEREEDILEEWKRTSVKAYEEEIPLKDGALEVLSRFEALGIPLAVATANRPELYRPCLERLKLSPFFSAFMDASRCPEGKTGTAMYDRLTKEAGLNRENVLVVEDSLLPMRLARDAGYLSIGVFDPGTTHSLEEGAQNCHVFCMNLWDLLHHLA